jgi:hypothetical protein
MQCNAAQPPRGMHCIGQAGKEGRKFSGISLVARPLRCLKAPSSCTLRA